MRWSHSSPRQEPAGPSAFGTRDLAFFKPRGREGLLWGPRWGLLAGWVVSSMCVNAGCSPAGRWEWSLNSVLWSRNVSVPVTDSARVRDLLGTRSCLAGGLGL